ncbi:hypothetical protein Fcan01_08666 [Folsomia candida]|uniref:Uncharacterized protein n=1 Tax=Folsomia candida TaxID=158441 RepID=A0A226EFG3_FOLCA|nr:hypothetical protein Fcan01_08666 [Folsomia candida]
MAYYSYDTYDPYYSYPVAEVAVVDVPVVEYGIEPVIYPPTSNMGYAQYDGYYDAGYVDVGYVDTSSSIRTKRAIAFIATFIIVMILIIVAAFTIGPRNFGGGRAYVSTYHPRPVRTIVYGRPPPRRWGR